MGIASLVIGIISTIIGFIPLCNYFALIPAGVGLILGIIDIPLSKKKQKSIGFGIAGTVLNAAAIILIIVWTMAIGGAASKTTDSLTKLNDTVKDLKNENTTENIKPEFSLSASALYKEYKKNEVAADNKYKDKIIKISGTVDSIGKDVMKNTYIMLVGEGVIEGLNGIQCFFPDKASGDIAKINKGDNVTIQGKCDGLMLGINLGIKNCNLVK